MSVEKGLVSGQRFLALDALRGLAALCVVYFHVYGGLGYLTVDFFLVLSGLTAMIGGWRGMWFGWKVLVYWRLSALFGVAPGIQRGWIFSCRILRC